MSLEEENGNKFMSPWEVLKRLGELRMQRVKKLSNDPTPKEPADAIEVQKITTRIQADKP